MSRRTYATRKIDAEANALPFQVLLIAPSLGPDTSVYRALTSLYRIRSLRLEELPNRADVVRSDLIIVDVARADASLVRSIRMIREVSPHVPIIGHVDLSPTAVHSLVDLARAGGDEIVIHGSENLPGRILEILKRTTSHRVADLVAKELGNHQNPLLQGVVVSSMRHGRESCGVDTLAADLGLSRRTLSKKLAEAGLPPASQILSWSRLIQAAGCLQSSDCSIEAVGLGLGFGSATALRNMLRRYTGMCCQEIRTPEGLSKIIVMFCALLTEIAL